MRYITSVPATVTEAVNMILGTIPGTAFYDADGNALILSDDHEYIVRVDSEDGLTLTAYLSTVPLMDLVERDSQFNATDLDAIQGFTTGFTC